MSGRSRQKQLCNVSERQRLSGPKVWDPLIFVRSQWHRFRTKILSVMKVVMVGGLDCTFYYDLSGYFTISVQRSVAWISRTVWLGSEISLMVPPLFASFPALIASFPPLFASFLELFASYSIMFTFFNHKKEERVPFLVHLSTNIPQLSSCYIVIYSQIHLTLSTFSDRFGFKTSVCAMFS